MLGDIFKTVIPIVAGFFLGPIGYGLATMAMGALFSKDIVTQGAKVAEFQVQNADVGVDIPTINGRMKVAGNIIWQRGFQEHKHREKVADGGLFGSDQYLETFYYSNTVAVGICNNEIEGIRRIWFDGKLVASVNNKEEDDVVIDYNRFAPDIEILRGKDEFNFGDSNETSGSLGGLFGSINQNVGAISFLGLDTSSKRDRGWAFKTFFNKNKEKSQNIINKEGEDLTPLFKELSYIIFKFGDLTDYGHRVPQIEVEVLEKGLDNEIEIIGDDEDTVIVTETDKYKYDFNILDLYKDTAYKRQSETITQGYVVSTQIAGNYFVFDSRNFSIGYPIENNDGQNVNSITNIPKSDPRLFFNNNFEFEFRNGLKSFVFNKNNYTIRNTNFDYFNSYSTSSNFLLNTLLSKTYYENNERRILNAPVASLFPINKVKYGYKNVFRILENKDYSCDMEISDYDIYDDESPDITNIVNNKRVVINTKFNPLTIDRIEGHKILRHFEYNNKNLVLACSNDEETEVYIYVVSIVFDTLLKRYELEFVKSATFERYNYFGSQWFYIYDHYNRNGQKTRTGFRMDYRSQTTSGMQAYYDPRFNVLVRVNSHTSSEYEGTLYIYTQKVNTNNGYDIFNRLENRNELITQKDSEDNFLNLYNIYFNFKNGLNLIAQYLENFDSTNQTVDLVEKEFVLSYWKNGEVPSDFVTYLDEVVENVLLDCGYKKEDIDVSALRNIQVDGFIYGNSSSRMQLERLQLMHQFSLIEEDWKFKAKLRGGSVDRVLSFDQDVGFNVTSDVKISRMISSSVELPTQYTLKYVSLNSGFLENTQKATYEDNHFKEEMIEVPAALTDNKAAQIVDIALAVSHREIYKYEFSISLEHIDLNVGDVIQIESEIIRITSIDIGNDNIKVVAVSDALNAYFSEVFGVNIDQSIINEIEFEPIIELVVFNGRALDNEVVEANRPILYYVPVATRSYDNTASLYSANSEEGLNIQPTVMHPGLGGFVANNSQVLNEGFDESEIILKFNFDIQTNSFNKEDLFNNKYINLIAIVKLNNTEFIQFKDIEKVEGEDHTYKITNMLRGRFNSKILDVTENDRFVVIDYNNIYTRSFELDRLYTSQYNKLTSSYIDFENAEVIRTQITGDNLKPSQVIMNDYYRENYDIHLSFTPISMKVNTDFNEQLDVSNLTYRIVGRRNRSIYETVETKDTEVILTSSRYAYTVEITTIDDNSSLESLPIVIDVR